MGTGEACGSMLETCEVALETGGDEILSLANFGRRGRNCCVVLAPMLVSLTVSFTYASTRPLSTPTIVSKSRNFLFSSSSLCRDSFSRSA